MAKATWQGYIALGQLGLPVKLYAAMQSIRPEFVQLHEKDGSPVERVLRCKDEHQEISRTETVRAVEVEAGKYVTLTDQELEQTASGPVKTIDIKQFFDPQAVEAIYYDKPYYIVPTHGGERAYSLLREVLVRSGKVAMVQFMQYNKERIGVLGVHGDMLVLQQLRYAAEIVPRSTLKTPPLPKPSPQEIEALSAVVERYSGPFYINDYHDEYAEHIQELVARKAKGLPAPKRERVAPHTTPENKIIDTLKNTLSDQPRLDSGQENIA